MAGSVSEELRALESVSEEELLRQFGEAVLAGPDGSQFEHGSGGLAGRQSRRERALAAADAWLGQHRLQLRDRLCGNERLREAFSADPGATVEIGKLVADALLGFGGWLPVVTIAALIARKGIDWICNDPA